MKLFHPFPFDVARIETETDVRAVNSRLKAGLVLLLVCPSPDGVGGFFPVYVLGERKVSSTRVDSSNEFDQRITS